MDEKDIKEIDRILDRINRAGRKYGEIILVVKNGVIRFIDFRGSVELLAEDTEQEILEAE
jgi:hypothetical protein